MTSYPDTLRQASLTTVRRKAWRSLESRSQSVHWRRLSLIGRGSTEESVVPVHVLKWRPSSHTRLKRREHFWQLGYLFVFHASRGLLFLFWSNNRTVRCVRSATRSNAFAVGPLSSFEARSFAIESGAYFPSFHHAPLHAVLRYRRNKKAQTMGLYTYLANGRRRPIPEMFTYPILNGHNFLIFERFFKTKTEFILRNFLSISTAQFSLLRNCAGAEGEEILIWLPSKREHVQKHN